MKKRGPGGGFSLIELIVVMAIGALVATLAIHSIVGTLQGSTLTAAGDEVSGALSLARQHAMARNRPVEVRWYQFADPTYAGEIAGSPATGHFRAMQAFEVDESGTLVAFTKMQRLPPGIIMDAGATLSSLLGSALASPNAAIAGSSQDILLPVIGSAYHYCAFEFFPDGSTNITTISGGGGPWFITLHSQNAGDNLGVPPKNYVMLEIDPTNGVSALYRP